MAFVRNVLTDLIQVEAVVNLLEKEIPTVKRKLDVLCYQSGW